MDVHERAMAASETGSPLRSVVRLPNLSGPSHKPVFVPQSLAIQAAADFTDHVKLKLDFLGDLLAPRKSCWLGHPATP